MNEAILRLVKIISRNERKSMKDNRRTVNCVIAEYRDDSGTLYNKAFESLPDKEPDIPPIGTALELAARKYQW